MLAFRVVADWADWASGTLQLQYPQDPQQVVQLVSDPEIAQRKVRVLMSGMMPFQLQGSDITVKLDYTRGCFLFQFGDNASARIRLGRSRANRAFDAVYEIFSLLDVYRSTTTIGACARILARINYLNEYIPTVMINERLPDLKWDCRKRKIKLYTPLKWRAKVHIPKKCLPKKKY